MGQRHPSDGRWRECIRGRAPGRTPGTQPPLHSWSGGRGTDRAVNLFSAEPHAFTEPDIARTQAFTDQAAAALGILLRQARHVALDDQLREALATRAVIDQALGILMVTRKISSRDAVDILRHTSQTTNRKVSDIAAELIQTLTGHPPEPPRPLTQRD